MKLMIVGLVGILLAGCTQVTLAPPAGTTCTWTAIGDKTIRTDCTAAPTK
jgi:hypothetical protein